MVLSVDGEIFATAQSFEARDYTNTFHLTGLESNTIYTYKVSCDALDQTGVVDLYLQFCLGGRLAGQG